MSGVCWGRMAGAMTGSGGSRELGRSSGCYSLGIVAHSSMASSVSRNTGFLENVRFLDV